MQNLNMVLGLIGCRFRPQGLQDLKSDEELSRLGLLRRQYQLALKAFAAYDVKFRRVVLANRGTNYIYRALADDGSLYALRLVAPGWRTEANLHAEIAWLDALARDATFHVPTIIPTSNGEPFIRLLDKGSVERRAVLMSWLPGMLLGRRLTPQNVRKMGELFAKLHTHSEGWHPPKSFPQTRFQAFLGRDEENLLFEEDNVRHYSAEDEAVIHRAIQRVESAYAKLKPTDLSVIHCDLWHNNIKIHQGELAPFDFEDTILGHRIHDIAMGLLDLATEVGIAEYERLLPYFRDGYESTRRFPVGDVIDFQVGRMLWQLNWFARFAGRHFARAAKFKIGVIRRVEAAGKLCRPLTP